MSFNSTILTVSSLEEVHNLLSFQYNDYVQIASDERSLLDSASDRICDLAVTFLNLLDEIPQPTTTTTDNNAATTKAVQDACDTFILLDYISHSNDRREETTNDASSTSSYSNKLQHLAENCWKKFLKFLKLYHAQMSASMETVETIVSIFARDIRDKFLPISNSLSRG
jgi:hypothetical protein